MQDLLEKLKEKYPTLTLSQKFMFY
jgi:hypothetical protein